MNTDRPLVSIIVCIYNAEASLRECLDSVLAQSESAWELICVDDGSKDGSVAIAQEYACRDARIRVFPREKNYGLLSGRKFGVSKASGEYVMFLDNDDALLPNSCADLIAIARETHSDVVQFGAELIFPEELSEEVRKINRTFFAVKFEGTITDTAEILRGCFQNRLFSWNLWNKVYDASLVQRVYEEIPDEFMIMPEDAYAVFRILSFAKRLTVRVKPYYLYRVASGISTQKRGDDAIVRDITTACLAVSRLREFLASHGKLALDAHLVVLEECIASYVRRSYACISSRTMRREAKTHIRRTRFRKRRMHWLSFVNWHDAYWRVRHRLSVGRRAIRGLYVRSRFACLPDTRPTWYDEIVRSGLFDVDQYRRRYADQLHGQDPIVHYVTVGASKGLIPSDRFLPDRYCAFYLDVDPSAVDPLQHYLRWGKAEGRHAFSAAEKRIDHYPPGFDAECFLRRQGKALIVVHQMDLSGVPMLSLAIAEAFARDRAVAVVSPSDGPLRDRCLKAGVPVIVDASFFVFEQSMADYACEGYSRALFNTIGLAKPFLRARRHMASVLWIHDNVEAGYLPPAIRAELATCRSVYATSAHTMALVRTYAPHVGYLPYFAKDLCGRAVRRLGKVLRFGIVGKVEYRKGQDLAVEAFARLPEEIRTNCELVVIGAQVDPVWCQGLLRTADRLPVRFEPPREDDSAYHALYDEFDVLLCPSRTDPMPLVVIDAMMHGCPVLLSDSVGEKDLVREGINGFVFPHDDVSAIVSVLVKMYEARCRYVEMSTAVRTTFEQNFDMREARLAVETALRQAGEA